MFRTAHVLIALTLVVPAARASAQAPTPAKPAAATPGQPVTPAKPAPAAPGQTAEKPAQPAPSKPAQPAPSKPAPAPPAPAQGQSAAPAPPAGAATPPAQEAYTYRPDGRRDPFTSLIGAGSKGEVTSRKGEGAAGLTVAELSVRGVMQSRGALVAMIQGPDNKTYIVHPGDKLLDGTIKSITPLGLVVVQEVNDPLSLIKQREVHKMLRSLEDAKE
jgi:Tfp pilus assembly protein PilP